MKRSVSSSGSRFPKSIFWIVLAVLLVTSGISVGIIVGMQEAEWAPIIQTHIMVFYWILASFILTLLIRARMKVTYDQPLQKISDATKRVASGDFSVRIDPIHEEGSQDYLDVMIHDLNAMIAELGSIETLKTDFVSNVSHEIKTPISVIQNYAQLLQSPDLTEQERNDYSRAISDAAMRLSSLITNILRLNRLENQKLAPSAVEFDLSSQLTECLLNIRNQLLFISKIFPCPHITDYFAVYNHLGTGMICRLQQNRIHTNHWLNTGRFRLHYLGTSHFQPFGCYKRI